MTEQSYETDVDGSDGPEPTSEAAAPGAKAGKRGKSRRRNSLEWVAIVVGALIVAVVVRTFLIQAFYIPSESMLPTLQVRDRVLVNKLSYDLHGVGRGDLVVFRSPEPGTTRDLIKRVIGLPGDEVESRNGKMFVNGKQLRESYLADGVITTPPVTKTKVPAGHYWVMGDNRAFSRDSRFIGPIPKSALIGRAFVKVWPITSFRFF